MSEFLTSYPRTISVIKDLQDFIHKEEIELNHLSLTVKIKRDEIINALMSEGFKRVKLENRKPTQIWHAKMRQYITSVIDNHQITLSAPRLPPIPWKHMAGSVVTLSLIYLAKFLGILQ